MIKGVMNCGPTRSVGGYYRELAMDASRAAINIELYVKGKVQQEFSMVEKLSKELYAISKNTYFEPRTDMIMTRVIWPNLEDWKDKTPEDIKLQTWLFAKNLETITKLTPEKQVELMGACLSLSRQAMDFSQPFILGLVA